MLAGNKRVYAIALPTIQPDQYIMNAVYQEMLMDEIDEINNAINDFNEYLDTDHIDYEANDAIMGIDDPP